jgi:hypothetical protein
VFLDDQNLTFAKIYQSNPTTIPCEFGDCKFQPILGCCALQYRGGCGSCNGGFNWHYCADLKSNSFPKLGGKPAQNIRTSYTTSNGGCSQDLFFTNIVTGDYTFKVSDIKWSDIQLAQKIFKTGEGDNKRNLDSLIAAYCSTKTNDPYCNAYCLQSESGPTGLSRTDNPESFCYSYATNFCTQGTNIIDGSGEFCYKAIMPTISRKYSPIWAESFVVNTFCKRSDAFTNPKYRDFCSCFKPNVNQIPSCTDGVCAGQGFKTKALIDQLQNCPTICLQIFNLDQVGGDVIYDKNTFNQQCGNTLRETTNAPGYTGTYIYNGEESIRGITPFPGPSPGPEPSSGLDNQTMIIIFVIGGILLLIFLIFLGYKVYKKLKSNSPVS